ncbi:MULTISPECIES: YceI family protein [unclassified Rhizobium]|uniref:YceI family protein n=1 Tax=unclassified Rhizobium TaxID=2613769 RepID=UPI00161D33CC|nr:MULTISPECIES: YceI family protein [unclassified Rhizobium]MBB3541372.1 polyisoprenoid-binding protein YceI [Rhizobium sp. BK399]MCS3740097.1 polyisoprenoid-binding protein YceI [Rhizobium sp. BK661]MCS4091953.1 polyisoprenoid-binding protein YceI [Rhizobium sp. BK176]
MLRITTFALALGLSTTLALAAATDPAPTGTYKTDPSHSSLSWSFDHSGLSHYTARFTKVDARLDWKPEQPETSTLSVAIDPLSVRTDYPWPEKVDFDAEIGTGETFLAAKPITFVSRTIHVTGENTGTVEGLLTFRGETHPATLDVTFNGSMAKHPRMGVPKIGFSATGRIRRSEWGLDFAIPELGDIITIAIETQMVPADHSF